MNKETKTKKWNRWIIHPLTKDYLIEYYENINQYPTKEELIVLSNKFNVTIRNINTFFQNRRHRSIEKPKKHKIKEEGEKQFERNQKDILNLIEYYKNLCLVFPLIKLPTFEQLSSLQLLESEALINNITNCICNVHEESVILEQFNKEDT